MKHTKTYTEAYRMNDAGELLLTRTWVIKPGAIPYKGTPACTGCPQNLLRGCAIELASGANPQVPGNPPVPAGVCPYVEIMAPMQS